MLVPLRDAKRIEHVVYDLRRCIELSSLAALFGFNVSLVVYPAQYIRTQSLKVVAVEQIKQRQDGVLIEYEPVVEFLAAKEVMINRTRTLVGLLEQSQVGILDAGK